MANVEGGAGDFLDDGGWAGGMGEAVAEAGGDSVPMCSTDSST